MLISETGTLLRILNLCNITFLINFATLSIVFNLVHVVSDINLFMFGHDIWSKYFFLRSLVIITIKINTNTTLTYFTE